MSNRLLRHRVRKMAIYRKTAVKVLVECRNRTQGTRTKLRLRSVKAIVHGMIVLPNIPRHLYSLACNMCFHVKSFNTMEKTAAEAIRECDAELRRMRYRDHLEKVGFKNL